MYDLTTEIVRSHQNALLAEADEARLGDHLARSMRLRRRAVRAERRARRANAQLG